MSTRSERIEARLSAEERKRIERAARFEGRSLSSFIVEAAVERADQILTESTVTVVPADYFDRLVAAMDEPGQAPRLEHAVARVRHGRRIE